MTRKKRNIRFRKSDAIITLFCLLILIASLFLFYKDITRIQTKHNEQPIATITFKYRTAQRKLNGRVLWDRLRQNSPVYNADTLRTAPQSEATLYLKDGNILDMNENTMIQIFYNETGAVLLSNGGSVTLDTTAGSAGFIIFMEDNSRIETGIGAVLNAKTSPDGLTVQVQNGTALVTSADGSTKTAYAGTELYAAPDGIITEPPLTVTAPLQNARILHFTAEDAGNTAVQVPVLFSWKTANPENGTSVRIETAYDKDFTVIAASRTEGESGSVSIPCKPGTVYWRVVRQNSGNQAVNAAAPESAFHTVSGKLFIVTAAPPKALSPVPGTDIPFRTENPVIRFTWTGNDWASAYEFEISADAEMTTPVVKQRVSGTSTSTAQIGEGTWFWRVTPYYTMQNIGFAEPSAVTPFTVRKSTELASPIPVIPGNGSVITRGAAETEHIRFSWKAVTDAVSYIFTVVSESEPENPVVSITTQNNYVSVPLSDDTVNIGTWYWSVTQMNGENEVSVPSPSYRFTIEPRKVPDRTLLYPPEGYTIQESLVSGLQFTWKTTDAQNECRLQLAAEPEFTLPVINMEVTGQTAFITDPGTGTWYWRICAADSETGSMLYSPIRTLTVVPELSTPVIVSPQAEQSLFSHANKPVLFKWQPVSGADYYIFKIYRTEQKEGNDTRILIAERNRLIQSELQLYLPVTEQYVPYVWSVEAAADETGDASLRTGAGTEQSVSVRSPLPVTLLAPAENVKIDGLNALRTPVRFSWSSIDPVAESQFVLKRLLPGGITQTVITRKNPPQTVTLERLRAGTYQWTIEARTSCGADIKARSPATFIISEPERLPQTTLLQPRSGTVFDSAYLHKNRTLRFAWQQVSGATEYVFSLYQKTADGKCGRLVTQQVLPPGKTELTLTDISILDAGTFIWNIDTNARAADGYLEQKGTPRTAEFTIDIAMPGTIVPDAPGKLYGN